MIKFPLPREKRPFPKTPFWIRYDWADLFFALFIIAGITFGVWVVYALAVGEYSGMYAEYVDGCKYIVRANGEGSPVHAGDCLNPIHNK